jgi:dolichol-phosphate mannosyltransferase
VLVDPYLSVVIPLRDELDSLDALHRELDAALAGVAGGVELVFVDDGSRDGSLERLLEISEKDPRVRVLSLQGRQGQSAALDAGFRAVRGEITATLDADLQNDPADLTRLLACLDHADVVGGIRSPRRSGRRRRLASWIANRLRNAATGESVTDVGCSLRVMRTEYLRRIKLYRGMHRFLPTLLHFEGARLAELPVTHRPRRYGRSKYGILDRLLPAAVDLLAVRWMKTRRFDYEVKEWRPGSGLDAGADQPRRHHH